MSVCQSESSLFGNKFLRKNKMWQMSDIMKNKKKEKENRSVLLVRMVPKYY